MSKSDAGKGDKPRPINKKIYDENFDKIFNQNQKTKFSDLKLVKISKGKKTFKF